MNKCECGHPVHIAGCLVPVLGIAPCGCERMPPPTDDELLLAFVDDFPNMAVSDYRQRCNLPFDRSPQHFHDHFRREWNKRMNIK